jgi:hypothetical protein
MVYFQAKNSNLGKFWRALDWKMLIYYMAMWNILQTFEICYDHFVFICYIFLVLMPCTNKNLATLDIFVLGGTVPTVVMATATKSLDFL